MISNWLPSGAPLAAVEARSPSSDTGAHGMKRSKFQKATGRAESGSFVRLPHVVIRSPQFAALPAHAVKALCGLLAQ